MYLRTIALKNIVRRKGKMAMVVAGLAVGVATLVAIVTLMLAFQKNIDKKLDTFGFNIVIYPASSNLSLSYGGMQVSGVDTYEVKNLTEADLKKIAGIKDADKISAASPKILQVLDIKGEQALLVGVDFTRELQIKKWWKFLGKKPAGADEIIIGQDAARALKVQATGQKIDLGGKTFTVAAILQDTGSQDDGLIFADLHQVQTMFNRGDELSLIEVAAKTSGDIDTVVKNIESSLPQASVQSIKQAVEYKEKAAGSLVSFGLSITAIIILISGLIVFTTMMSSVSDRRREIGIFRAIGYRQAVISKIVLLEALILSLIGGVIGYLVGFGAVYVLPAAIENLELIINPNFVVLALSVGLAVLVGIVSSFIPARRAATMDPAEALKSL